jgi:hypothetical protein
MLLTRQVTSNQQPATSNQQPAASNPALPKLCVMELGTEATLLCISSADFVPCLQA